VCGLIDNDPAPDTRSVVVPTLTQVLTISAAQCAHVWIARQPCHACMLPLAVHAAGPAAKNVGCAAFAAG
jgi:hypothetical protein